MDTLPYSELKILGITSTKWLKTCYLNDIVFPIGKYSRAQVQKQVEEVKISFLNYIGNINLVGNFTSRLEKSEIIETKRSLREFRRCFLRMLLLNDIVDNSKFYSQYESFTKETILISSPKSSASKSDGSKLKLKSNKNEENKEFLGGFNLNLLRDRSCTATRGKVKSAMKEVHELESKDSYAGEKVALIRENSSVTNTNQNLTNSKSDFNSIDLKGDLNKRSVNISEIKAIPEFDTNNNMIGVLQTVAVLKGRIDFEGSEFEDQCLKNKSFIPISLKKLGYILGRKKNWTNRQIKRFLDGVIDLFTEKR